MKHNRVAWSLFSLASLMLIISCDDDSSSEVKDVSRYEWQKSALSPNGLFFSALLKVGDDGRLYAFGTSGNSGAQSIFQYADNIGSDTKWVFVSKPQTDAYYNLENLAIFQGSIYYHGYNKLYKQENGSVLEVLSANVLRSIKVYNGKLIINGEGINISNNKFTVVSYDGTTFSPLSDVIQPINMMPANDKLYFPGWPAFVYDGQDLRPLDYSGYIYAVDVEESIYFGEAIFSDFTRQMSGFTMEKKLLNGEISTVGNTVHKFGFPDIVQFYDGTLVMTGRENGNGPSTTFYLDDEKWIQIPTEHMIFDVIVYNDKLLSISLDGNIFELVKK